VLRLPVPRSPSRRGERLKPLDVLVVGAGFAGATCARILADAGCRVHLIDRRAHIGGNAYDTLDAHGVMVHPYGAHVFHTNAGRIVEFLSRFTAWRPYEHRVLAKVGNELLPFPINRATINRLYGLSLDERGAADFLARAREPRAAIRTSEDAVLAAVGRDLCEKFYRGYTLKQWGRDLSQLAAGVAARIPVRTGDDDRYFTDTYQCMPAEGYTAMFRRMLEHPLISWETGVEFAAVSGRFRYRHLVYTGPIDAYFDFRHGRLPYRSLEFRHEHLPDVPVFQETGAINYPNDFEYTRVIEFKHLTGQAHRGTSIMREYPRAEGDPYYPVPTPESAGLFKRYQADADACAGVTFVGRLAQYRYYNMDQVVGAALAAGARLVSLLKG